MFRFATPNRVNFAPFTVTWSNVKSPVSPTPATVSVAPTTVTDTYGPFGTCSPIVTPPAWNDWSTGIVSVLISSVIALAESVNGPRWSGSSVTVNDAAIPCDVISIEPLPVTCRIVSPPLVSVSSTSAPPRG